MFWLSCVATHLSCFLFFRGIEPLSSDLTEDATILLARLASRLLAGTSQPNTRKRNEC